MSAWPLGDPDRAVSAEIEDGRALLRLAAAGIYEVACGASLERVEVAGPRTSVALEVTAPGPSATVGVAGVLGADTAVEPREGSGTGLVAITGERVVEACVIGGDGRVVPALAAARGEARTASVAAGEVIVRARFEGDASGLFRFEARVAVGEGRTVSVDARAEPGSGAIRGFLAWRGAAESDVAAAAATRLVGPGLAFEPASLDRAFRLDGLAPGRYRVELAGRLVREVVLEGGASLDLGVVALGAD